MATRRIEQPTLNEHGDETHPGWGMVSVHRVQIGPPGVTLFDSDINHRETMVIRLSRAARRRELNHDWIHSDHRSIVEIEMSLAQWASFISSPNTSGVSCTIRRTPDEVFVAEMPADPRMRHAIAETTGAATRAFERIKEALEAYVEKKNAANLRALILAVEHVEPNISYATKTLVEHSENVVQRARADVEAMVVNHARQLGLTDNQALEIGRSMAAIEEGDADVDG